MKRLSLLFLLVPFALAACATPRAAYKPGFDFSRIRTVSVGVFTSAPNQPNSGDALANEFVRQLLTRGYTVTGGEAQGADAVLQGSVTEFQPTRRYLVQTGSSTGTAQQVVVVQPPVELGGSNTYNLGSAFGLGDNARIIVSNATVGVSAYLRDVQTGEIVWSNAYTYEGLDLNAAMEGAVRYLLRSWPPAR